MKDETYVFISDVKEKGSIGRSARNRKTHAGKGGRVRLPSDNLSKKELLKMNGECKSYRLNDPMTKEEFQAMPTDLKIAYIKAIRSKYGIPDSHLAKAIGYQQQHFSKMMKKMGIDNGKGAGKRKWDKEGFYAWWHGVDKLPTPTIEEVAITQEEKEAIFFGEEKGYVEEDLPFEEPDPIPIESECCKPIPVTAVPSTGSMTFTCPANQALNTLAQVLGEANVSISVMWRVVEEGGAEDD